MPAPSVADEYSFSEKTICFPSGDRELRRRGARARDSRPAPGPVSRGPGRARRVEAPGPTGVSPQDPDARSVLRGEDAGKDREARGADRRPVVRVDDDLARAGVP